MISLCKERVDSKAINSTDWENIKLQLHNCLIFVSVWAIVKEIAVTE